MLHGTGAFAAKIQDLAEFDTLESLPCTTSTMKNFQATVQKDFMTNRLFKIVLPAKHLFDFVIIQKCHRYYIAVKLIMLSFYFLQVTTHLSLDMYKNFLNRNEILLFIVIIYV